MNRTSTVTSTVEHVGEGADEARRRATSRLPDGWYATPSSAFARPGPRYLVTVSDQDHVSRGTFGGATLEEAWGSAADQIARWAAEVGQ